MPNNFTNVKLSAVDIFFIFVLLTAGLYRVYATSYLPLTEDAGFYALYPKAILQHAILHQDIHAATNSLLFYITAFAYKLFGIKKIVFQWVYGLSFTLLGLVLYLCVRNAFNPTQALCTVILCANFITIPDIILDLGRNQIMWCLTFIFFGLHLKISRNQNFWFGFCLGIAALIRETFLVVPIYYGLIEIIKFLLSRDKNKIYNKFIKEFTLFLAGLLVALSINAAILTYYNVWSGYFIDMLHTGVSFRYSEGFFSLHRVMDNRSTFSHDFYHYYAPIFLLAIISFFLRTNHQLIKMLRVFLLPIFLFEALVINAALSYTILPTLTVASILATFTIISLGKKLLEKSYHLTIKEKVLICPAVIILTISPYYLYNIYIDFRWYYHIANLAKNNTNTENWQAIRLLNIVNHIPASNIAALAQYPTLFETTVPIDYKYPNFFDLRAPYFLAIPQMAADQLEAFETQKVDLLLLKTRGSYDEQSDAVMTPELMKAIKDNYYTIANFNFSENNTVRPYKDRIFISHKLFTAKYHLLRSLHVDSEKKQVKVENTSNNEIIIKVTAQPVNCISSYTITSGLSNITYHTSDYAQEVLFGFITPKQSAIISKNPNCQGLIELYEPN